MVAENKYKTLDGSVMEEAEAKELFGDDLETMIDLGQIEIVGEDAEETTVPIVEETGAQEEVESDTYITNDGTELTTEEAMDYFGDSLEDMVSLGQLKKKEPSVVTDSVSVESDTTSAQEPPQMDVEVSESTSTDETTPTEPTVDPFYAEAPLETISTDLLKKNEDEAAVLLDDQYKKYGFKVSVPFAPGLDIVEIQAYDESIPPLRVQLYPDALTDMHLGKGTQDIEKLQAYISAHSIDKLAKETEELKTEGLEAVTPSPEMDALVAEQQELAKKPIENKEALDEIDQQMADLDKDRILGQTEKYKRKYFKEQDLDYETLTKADAEIQKLEAEIAKIESAPASTELKNIGYDPKFPQYEKQPALSAEQKKQIEEKEKRIEEITEANEALTSGAYSEAKFEIDRKLEQMRRVTTENAIRENNKLKEEGSRLEAEAQKKFGVPLQELGQVKFTTQEQVDEAKALYKQAYDLQNKQKIIGQMYSNSATYFDAKTDKAIQEEFVGQWEGFVNQARKGWSTGWSVTDVMKSEMGVSTHKEAAQMLALEEARRRTMTDSKAMAKFNSAKSFTEQLAIFGNDPFEVIGGLAANSLAMMLPISAYTVPSSALAGSVIPGIGTGLGIMGGMTMTTVAMEYGNSIMDAMRKKGVDVGNAEEVEKAFGNEEIMNEGRRIGLIRGITIAGFDLITAGVASRLVTPFTSKGMAIARGVATATAIDPVFEATGEGLAMLFSGQEVKATDMFAEALGGPGMAAPTTAMMIYNNITNKTMKNLAFEITDFNALMKYNQSESQINSWADKLKAKGLINEETLTQIKENTNIKGQIDQSMTDMGFKPWQFKGKKDVRNALTQIYSRRQELEKNPDVNKKEIKELTEQANGIIKAKEVTAEAKEALGIVEKTKKVEAAEAKKVADKMSVPFENLTEEQQQERVGQFQTQIDNVKQSLGAMVEGAKVEVAPSQEAFETAVKEAGQKVIEGENALVIFDADTGKFSHLVVNAAKANEKTVMHEAMHVVLQKTFGNDQAKFKEFQSEISGTLTKEGYGGLAKKMEAFANQDDYSGVQGEEFLAELGAALVSDGFDVKKLSGTQKTTLQKIAQAINKMVQTITNSDIQVFAEDASPESILEFLGETATKIKKGEDVTKKILTKREQRVKEQAKKRAEAKKDKPSVAKAKKVAKKKAAETKKKLKTIDKAKKKFGTVGRQLELGFTKTDKQAIEEGASVPIGNPTTIKKSTKKRRSQIEFKPSYPLSFVKPSDKIDIVKLIDEIVQKDQQVFFWTADQLGRGIYLDTTIGKEHFLDAGPSYALDPKNRKKKQIWATGKTPKALENYLNSDYIFIISGSPLRSKLFNKSVFDVFANRMGEYSAFKKAVLKTKPTKPIVDVIKAFDSWSALRDSPKRKALLNAIIQQEGTQTDFKKYIESKEGFVDYDSLRDGFYRENDFEMNDVMLVLKPNGKVEGKADHSTYLNNIMGEVVGVPDQKVDAFELLPNELKKRYKLVLDKEGKEKWMTTKRGKEAPLGKAEKGQSAAPYGQRKTKLQKPKVLRRSQIGEQRQLETDLGLRKDGLLKKYLQTDKGYRQALTKAQAINRKLTREESPYKASITKVPGEKGDKRVYYAVNIVPRAERRSQIDDYRGSHTSPRPEEGVKNRADDMSDIYPDDIYGPMGERYYGDRSTFDRKTINIIKGMRGNPNKEITIYRAVPKGVKKINPGDWVGLTREYATQHGLGDKYNPEMPVISMKVKVKDLYTDGNSIHEWGYHPAGVERRSQIGDEGMMGKYMPEKEQKSKIKEYTHVGEQLRTRWADWFLGESVQAKNYIAYDIDQDSELRRAMKSALYDLWKAETGSDISFKKFLDSEITVYRALSQRNIEKGDIVEDGFNTYTLQKDRISRYGETKAYKKKVKDLYGAVQIVGGEIEVLEPTKYSEDFSERLFNEYSDDYSALLSDSDIQLLIKTADTKGPYEAYRLGEKLLSKQDQPSRRSQITGAPLFGDPIDQAAIEAASKVYTEQTKKLNKIIDDANKLLKRAEAQQQQGGLFGKAKTVGKKMPTEKQIKNAKERLKQAKKDLKQGLPYREAEMELDRVMFEEYAKKDKPEERTVPQEKIEALYKELQLKLFKGKTPRWIKLGGYLGGREGAKVFNNIMGTDGKKTDTYQNLKFTLRKMAQAARISAKTTIQQARAWYKVSRAMEKRLRKELNDTLRSMMKDTPSLTGNVIKAIMNKYRNTNIFNEESRNKFVDYLEKVIKDEALRRSLDQAYKNIKQIRDNIKKAKYGPDLTLVSDIKRLIALSPTLVPLDKPNVFQEYTDILNELGQKGKVIGQNLDEISALKDRMAMIMKEVYEQEFLLTDLSNRFYEYIGNTKNLVNKKATTKAAMILSSEYAKSQKTFSQILSNMVEDEIISEDERNLMLDNKDMILSKETVEKKSAEEKQLDHDDAVVDVLDAIADVNEAIADEPGFFNTFPEGRYRDLAKKFVRTIKENKNGVVQDFTTTELKQMAQALRALTNGLITNVNQEFIESIEGKIIDRNVNKVLHKAELRPFEKYVGIVKAFINRLPTGRDNATMWSEAIRRNPLAYVDQTLGMSMGRAIYKNLFEPVARGYSLYQNAKGKLNTKLKVAQEKLAKAYGQDSTAIAKAKFRIQAALLQQEYISNPNNTEVAPAIDFLKETLKQAKTTQKNEYSSQKNQEAIQEIIDKLKKGKTAEEQMKILMDDLDAPAKEAMKEISNVYKSMTKEYVYTATIIRGQEARPRKDYVHIQVTSPEKLGMGGKSKSIADEFMGPRMKTTKSGLLHERTPGAKPIRLDPFVSASSAVTETMMDYHLTIPMRTVSKGTNSMIATLDRQQERYSELKEEIPSKKKELATTKDEVRKKELEKEIKEDEKELAGIDLKRLNKEKEVADALRMAIRDVQDNILENDLIELTMIDVISEELAKAGYVAMLASPDRMAAEYVSNLAAAQTAFKPQWNKGGDYTSVYSNPQIGSDVMTNVGSTQIEKSYPANEFGGAMTEKVLDTSSFGPGRITSGMADRVNAIYNKMGINIHSSIPMIGGKRLGIKEARELSMKLGDWMITTPDQVVTRRVWFGSFAQKFEQEVQAELDSYKDKELSAEEKKRKAILETALKDGVSLEKIAANDQDYKNNFEDILEASRSQADSDATDIGAAKNPAMGLIKNMVSAKDNAMVRNFKRFNSFMTNFMMYEYAMFRKGIDAAVGKGDLTPSQGALLMTAAFARMTTYTFLTTTLYKMPEMLFREDDDEEDEYNMGKEIYRSVANALLNLTVMKNFGNFVRGAQAWLMEEYGNKPLVQIFSEDKKYDSFDDSLVWGSFPVKSDDVKPWENKTIFELIATQMFGPFSPSAKTVSRTYTVAAKEPKTEEAKQKRLIELMTRTPFEGAGNLGFIPMYKLLRRVLLAYLYKGYKEEKKATKYQTDEDSKSDQSGFNEPSKDAGFGNTGQDGGFGSSEEQEGF